LFNRQSHAVTLAVKLSKDIEESNTKYIFTFDNISELVSAQRKAAWSDVARRIAHEIKNPLTPIQLSAERIKRKYSVQISSDKDIFENCISTIVAHVEQIGSMVDEFANFAKMPSAKLEKKDISSLITQVVALQKMAHTNVSYIWEPQDEECLLMLDKNLFTQGLTNLLLNAYESFEGLADQDLSIRILLIRQESQLIVCIEDNGKGLPKENREKLTEPYITTRVKGTGLGLAIVKHIMEEHKGDLRLGDSVDLKGAKIEMIFQDQLLSL
jgi:two-component system nitrogen regulation sensor histidine kinase NtrY